MLQYFFEKRVREDEIMIKQLSNWPPYKNYYQFVGAAKYRKNLFFNEEIRKRLAEIVQDVLQKKGIEVVAVTVAYNHFHVLIRTELTPSQVGQILFGASSRLLKKEFPVLISEAQKGLLGGKSWEAVRDKRHLENCKSYIERHRPDNTKMESDTADKLNKKRTKYQYDFEIKRSFFRANPRQAD